MELKDYQNDVLDSLSGHLGALAEKRQAGAEFRGWPQTIHRSLGD